MSAKLVRAVATGNFDGVHRGHARIFSVMDEVARKQGLESVVVAYDPHTRHVLGTPGKPALLTPGFERQKAVENLGFAFSTLPFDRKLSSLPGIDFVREVILGQFQAKVWVFGEDHRFGWRGEGRVEDVRRLFPELEIHCVPPVLENAEAISSSRVRGALDVGDLPLANRLLGRPYELVGLVVHGEARGRQIGFPTANLEMAPHKHVPAFGVYAGRVALDGIERVAVVNVGKRPTFSGVTPSIEVHLPGWSGDLYGKTLQMKLDLFLRGELRFSSVEELKSQIACDVQRAFSMIQIAH